MMTVRVAERTWLPTVLQEPVGGRTVFFASHPALLGVDAQGDSEEEARQGFAENLRRYLEHLASTGQDLPEPTHFVFEVVVTAAEAADLEFAHERQIAAQVLPSANKVPA
ncbi:MAG: hypothetical protein AKCLJLPJ_01446 [Fimbriimonadales bacterium]|nr:hypothetical protein [Fimbriimonadales bacterium]